MSTTAYDESGTQVRQVACSLGPEDEPLSVTGSTEPRSMTYDAAYRTSVLLDGKSQGTHYYYNTAGYLDHLQYPDGKTEQYPLYDSLGRPLKRIDGNNVETDYLYQDPESALTDIKYPATPGLNIHLAYDVYGRTVSMTDGTGTQKWIYDDTDDVLTAQTAYTGLPAEAINYSYYPNGSRKGMQTPAGAFGYSYDGDGLPVGLTNPCNRTASWSYLDNGWLSAQALGNGVTSTYIRNQRGFLTDLLTKNGQGQTLSEFSGTGGAMQYDAVGNRVSMTATIPAYAAAAGTTTYQYTSQDELTQEQSGRNGGYTNNFGYDAAFNPTTFKGVTRTFNSNNQDMAFTFDSNGNPTTYNGNTLGYDPEDRLTSYGTVMTAGYNGQGMRAWKQTSAGRTYCLYDGETPVCELSSTGVVTAFNTFGPEGLIGRNTGAGSTLYSFDPQGSVCQRLDGNGNVLSTAEYDAFGNAIGTASSDPFGYGGQWGYYTESETGLLLLGHRYYDAAQGRFLNRDPIGSAGGINLYGYTRNGPVSRIDPVGTDVWVMQFAGGGIFGSHAAIAVDWPGGSPKSFDFGPGADTPPWMYLFGGAVPGEVEVGSFNPQNPSIPSHGAELPEHIVRMTTTCGQDKAIRTWLIGTMTDGVPDQGKTGHDDGQEFQHTGSYGDYNGLWHECANYVWDALSAGDVGGSGEMGVPPLIFGSVTPTSVIGWAGQQGGEVVR